MANQQKLASVTLGGANLRRSVGRVPLMQALALEADDDAKSQLQVIEAVAKGLENINVKEKKEELVGQRELEEQSLRLRASAALGEQRKQFLSAKNNDEFEQMAETSPKMLKADFSDDYKSLKFWDNHGDNLLRAHAHDIEHIRESKKKEFSKSLLAKVLAEHQQVLAIQPENDAEKIIDEGVFDIENNNFLSVEDKQNFRSQYLNNSILNVALNNPDKANEMQKKYMPDDENLAHKVHQIRLLRMEDNRVKEEKKQHQEYLFSLGRALDLWQKKESGQLDLASYYVLNNGGMNNIDLDDDKGSLDNVLSDAYLTVKKINGGYKLNDDELENVERRLACAYKQNKLGYLQTIGLQNKLLQVQSQKNDFFDQNIDEFNDAVLGKDTNDRSNEGKSFMENKAKYALEIYDTYYNKKNALIEEALSRGENLNAHHLNSISTAVLDDIENSFGYKKNIDEFSFDDLRDEIRTVYYGKNQDLIWQNFFKKAPFFDDKKALMRKLAASEQKKELSIPQFESLDEYLAANLDVGAQFYFKGRLAVKSA